MANSYANLLLFEPQSPPADWLRENGRPALVGEVGNNRVLVLDPEAEKSPEALKPLARDLSSACSCLALGSSVRDDDELRLVLYRAGNLEADYTSRRLAGKQAAALCRAFGKPNKALPLWLLLNLRPVLLETWRHNWIVKMLDLPVWLVGSGYRYHLNGDAPSACEDFELQEATRSGPPGSPT